eukprot:763420-Hanusia_phi.AAC.3
MQGPAAQREAARRRRRRRRRRRVLRGRIRAGSGLHPQRAGSEGKVRVVALVRGGEREAEGGGRRPGEDEEGERSRQRRRRSVPAACSQPIESSAGEGGGRSRKGRLEG